MVLLVNKPVPKRGIFLHISYIIDISCIQITMGRCGSERGTFEMLLAGPGQIQEESQEDEERESKK